MKIRWNVDDDAGRVINLNI